MSACPTVELAQVRHALRAELRVTREWFGKLWDFGAPEWKLEQVRELVDDLEIECVVADLHVLGELSEADCEAIINADHAGLWDV